MNLTKHCFFICSICQDCSFSIAEFSISKSCFCLHFFTVYKQDNYLHNGLMGHSNNLGNLKVKVILTTRKPPHQISDRRTFFYYIFLLHFFFFLRGKGGAATPQEPVCYAYGNYYIQFFTSLMFNNKNLVILKRKPLKCSSLNSNILANSGIFIFLGQWFQ